MLVYETHETIKPSLGIFRAPAYPMTHDIQHRASKPYADSQLHI